MFQLTPKGPTLGKHNQTERRGLPEPPWCPQSIYCHTPAQKPPYLFATTHKGEQVFAASARVLSPSTAHRHDLETHQVCPLAQEVSLCHSSF